MIHFSFISAEVSNRTYSIEVQINADIGVTVTKKIHTVGSRFENDYNTTGNNVSDSEIRVTMHKFSLKNSIEFRCITQAELDVLKWEEQNTACYKTRKQYSTNESN